MINLSQIGFYFKGIRVPFLSLVFVFVPVTLVISWYHGFFNPLNAILTLIGLICFHASANTFNDYFDYRSGIDTITTPTPFSGGSRVLPDKQLSPRSMLAMACGFLIVGSGIGVYFTILFGIVIFSLLLISVLSIYFYSTMLANWGLGELIIGLNFGPLLSMGVYYVQAQSISIEPLLVGGIMGVLTASIVYINEFPDHDADQAKGRYNLVVRLGKKKATNGFIILMIVAYVILLVSVLFRITPPLTIIGFVSLPLVIKVSRILKKHYDETPNLIPGMALTIICTLITGIMILLAYLIEKLLFVV